MNKKSFFNFCVASAFACSFVACGGDDDKPEPLVPAFVSVEAADASVLLLGDAGSREITVKANRELEITTDASWLTVSASATDATTSSARLTVTVTKNETAFKGRVATVSIAAKASREDDIVSGASAKASIEVRQSLFGLPVADLFDWKADAAGNVSDVSANAMTIIVGAAKPVISFNSVYGLYEASISEISSEAYPADHKLFPGNSDYAAIGEQTYQAADGEHKVESKRMSYYKIPWSTNTAIVNAYKNAFSYELIYSAPEYTDNMNNNLFGNVNPTHCGFGIQRRDNRNAFTYHPAFGNTIQLRQKDDAGEDVIVEFDRYYHIVATYDKNSPTELIAFYVDGVKVGGSGSENIGLQLHFPTDYYAMQTGHTHNEADRTPQTEYLCIGGGSHQSGYPSFGAPHNTKVVVARVYGKALTPTEVTALYNYHKPE
jgi:hypothetical protein